MSADNWGICPKCKANAKNEAASMYGKIPADEYLVLLKKEKEADTTENLREDYCIGTYGDGKFSVSYSCRCSVCGFSFKYKYSEQLKY